MTFETAHRRPGEVGRGAGLAGPGRPGALRPRRHRSAGRRGGRPPAAARTALLGRVERRALRRGGHPSPPSAGSPGWSCPCSTDACIVTVVDREGRPATSAPGTPTRPGGRSWSATPSSGWTPCPSASPVAQALHAGTPVTESVDAVLRLMPPGPARDLLAALGPATAVVLPLHRGGTHRRRPHALPRRRAHPQRRGPGDRPPGGRRGRAGGRARAPAEPAGPAGRGPPAQPAHRSARDGRAWRSRCATCPAAEAARVGGDWYDAFLQRDGTPVLVIGDVVGHDTAAAAAMGQLRALLRGIAHYSGAGPAEVLRGLDEAIARHAHRHPRHRRGRPAEAGRPATARRRLRWANAGHPPPILRRPDGRTHGPRRPDR